jgi:hypothetical protein
VSETRLLAMPRPCGAAIRFAATLLHRGPRETTAYAGFTDPEPVPLDWQAIEPRWDCLPCRSTQAAEILPTSYRCLKCGTEGFIQPT